MRDRRTQSGIRVCFRLKNKNSRRMFFENKEDDLLPEIHL